MKAPRNDGDLLSRVKRRDPSAMGELYDRHGAAAYAVVLRLVPHPEIAQDLLAQTFVLVWNQIFRWKDARFEDLRLWLLLLARNHAIDYLRSQNEPLPRALPRLTGLTQPSLLQDFPRPRDAEEWDTLRDAFSTLTEKESNFLALACFDGIPLNEIAMNSGQTLSSVREIIDSALHKVSLA